MPIDLDPRRLDDFERLLRAGPGVRVGEERLWAAFAAAFPGRPQPPEERRWLISALQRLEERGVVRLPPPASRRWDRSSGIAVPRGIDVIRAAEPARPRRFRSFPWHPRLHWVADLPWLTADAEAFLVRVHEGLVEDRFSEPAPLKYRSLELTGDEKRLGALAKTQLFGPGRLSFDLLGCVEEALPLAWARVGPRPRMIVFENAAPFMVARDVLASMREGPYGLVAFGWGARFEASLPCVTRLGCDVDQVDYVGDLDAAGLEIAASAQAAARRLGLPPLAAAPGAHAAMLRSAAGFGQPLGWPAKRSARGTATERLLRFLPAEVRAAVAELLAAGRRIPEEVLGPRELRRLWGEGR